MLPLFLDTAQFAQFIENGHREDLLIIDLGSQERFLNHHIPGAVLVTPAQTQAGKPVPGLIPSPDALNDLMQSIGYSPDKHIVVYDDEGGGWAGRFIWMLDEIGHQHYSYLDGGLVAWQAEGLATEAGASCANKTSVNVEPSGDFTVTGDALINELGDNELCIWDARSPGEYTGEKKNAARAGRVPGALNYEWTDAMDKSNHLRLKPLDQLQSEIEAKGISLGSKLVTHCQTHHRSGLTYLIAKLLGATNVRAYAGSWGEWGNREDTPIEV